MVGGEGYFLGVEGVGTTGGGGGGGEAFDFVLGGLAAALGEEGLGGGLCGGLCGGREEGELAGGIEGWGEAQVGGAAWAQDFQANIFLIEDEGSGAGGAGQKNGGHGSGGARWRASLNIERKWGGVQ